MPFSSQRSCSRSHVRVSAGVWSGPVGGDDPHRGGSSTPSWFDWRRWWPVAGRGRVHGPRSARITARGASGGDAGDCFLVALSVLCGCTSPVRRQPCRLRLSSASAGHWPLSTISGLGAGGIARGPPAQQRWIRRATSQGEGQRHGSRCRVAQRNSDKRGPEATTQPGHDEFGSLEHRGGHVHAGGRRMRL